MYLTYVFFESQITNVLENAIKASNIDKKKSSIILK